MTPEIVTATPSRAALDRFPRIGIASRGKCDELDEAAASFDPESHPPALAGDPIQRVASPSSARRRFGRRDARNVALEEAQAPCGGRRRIGPRREQVGVAV